jgi:hypothetical protein
MLLILLWLSTGLMSNAQIYVEAPVIIDESGVLAPEEKHFPWRLQEVPGGEIQTYEIPYTGISQKQTQIVGTSADWHRLSTLLGWQQGNIPFNPETEVVVAIFLGYRPTGGYAIAVDCIQTSSSDTSIKVREITPRPDMMTTQALTSPGLLIKLPKPRHAIHVDFFEPN